MRSDFHQVFRLGLMTLTFSVLPSIYFLTASPKANAIPISVPSDKKNSESSFPRLASKLKLESDFSVLSPDNARAQLSFSVDPPRPDSKLDGSRVMIRLAQSKQIKRIELPARVDLEFSNGVLNFSQKTSQFWLLCSSISKSEISAALFYQTPEREEVLSANWIVSAQEPPIQSFEEFSLGTPFRELGESRWWGHDVFLEKYAGGKIVHQIEIGSASKTELFDCSLNDWLVFKEGRWQKVSALPEGQELPIARLKSISSEGIEIEGWDGASHIRMKLVQASLPPLKMKGEELFAQLRIRSEKQVSCMLEKQCLILRTGDWALKSQGRWRVLRKKEEKASFLDGRLSGEIFVLDRIEAKGAGKSVHGHYFSSGRSQMVSIEYVQKPLLHKGSGKKR